MFEFWRQIRNCDFLNTHISIGRSKNSSKDTKRAYYLWYTICAGLFIFVRIALVFGRFHLPYRYNIHAFWRFHSVVAHSKSERTIERPNERASVWVSKRASERASEQSVSTIICAVAVVCVWMWASLCMPLKAFNIHSQSEILGEIPHRNSRRSDWESYRYRCAIESSTVVRALSDSEKNVEKKAEHIHKEKPLSNTVLV